MNTERIYDIAKDLAMFVGFVLIIISSGGIIFARNMYDITFSAGFLIISLLFTLEVWVVIKTKWEIE